MGINQSQEKCLALIEGVMMGLVEVEPTRLCEH